MEKLTRREFLRIAGIGLASIISAACAPTAPQIVEVEKPVVVKEEVVKEVPVEKVVEKEVVKQVVVTPTPGPKLTLWAPKHFLPAQNDFFTDSALLTAARNNFEVEVQLFPWGEYRQKQNTAIEAGTLPDVCLGVDVAGYHAMGILLDVSDLFEEIGETGGGWYEANVTNVTIEGKQYGIPFHNEPQFIYYRSDIFAEAGYDVPVKDLDEFVEVAKAVTDPAKKIWGFGNTFSNVPDGNNAFTMFMWAFGGAVQDEAGNVVVNSPETLEALRFYCDLHTQHKVMPPGVTGWDDTGNNKAYLSGQCAMILNTGSVIYAMRGDDPGWLENTVLGPLPAGPAGPKTFNGGSTAGIFNSTKYPEVAGELIKGVLSPDRYPGNLAAAGAMFFPVLKDYANDPFFTEDQWNKQITACLPHVQYLHDPGDPQPWLGEIGGKWLWSEMTSRVAVEGWECQKALDDFEKKVIEIKEKYERL